MPNIIQTHREGPEGPFVVGSQWQETRNLLFLRGSLHLEVTELQPSRVQWVLKDGHATFRYTFSLTPSVKAGSTDVLCEVVCTACYGGTEAARLACFMQQKDSVLLQRLKLLLEPDQADGACNLQPAGPIAAY